MLNRALHFSGLLLLSPGFCSEDVLKEADYELNLRQTLHLWSISPPFAHLDTYLNGANFCEGRNRYDLEKCANNLAHSIFNEHKADSLPLWNRSDTASIGNLSCSYEVFQQATVISLNNLLRDNVALHLRILQANCSDSFPRSKGGTSFEVVFKGNRLVNCEVVDLFDNTYDVYCPSRYEIHLATHHQFGSQSSVGLEIKSYVRSEVVLEHFFNNGCADVAITVDYENFDAFAIQGNNILNDARCWKPLRKQIEVSTRQYCIETVSGDLQTFKDNHNGEDQALLNHKHTHHMYKRKAAVTKMSMGHWKLNTSVSLYHPDEDNNREFLKGYYTKLYTVSSGNFLEVNGDRDVKWAWEWSHDVDYLNRVNIMDCLATSRVIIIGESHSRYNWDSIVMSMPTPDAKKFLATLARKHPETEYSNLEYQEVYFARNMAHSIDSICDYIIDKKDTRNFTIVLQWGAWDETYWPIDYILKDRRSAQYLVEMLKFTSSRACFSQLSFIFLSNVPYFLDCETNGTVIESEPSWRASKTCDYFRGCRNTYKGAAVNEYFERQVLELNLPRYQYIDAYSILAARLPFKEYVCANHFMCREDNNADIVLSTPGGAVVAEAIKRAICNAAFETVAS